MQQPRGRPGVQKTSKPMAEDRATILANELCEAHDAKKIRSPVNKEER